MLSFHDWKQAHVNTYGRVHVRDWYHAAYGAYCERVRHGKA